MGRFIPVLIFMLMATAAEAQRRLPIQKRTLHLGFGIQVGVPQGEYAALVGYPMGLSANLSIPTSRWSWFELGGDFSYHTLGSNKLQVNIGDNPSSTRQGEMRVAHSLRHYHFQGRFRPFNRRIRPYVDGLIGMKQHVSNATTKYDNGWETVTTSKEQLYSDWTPSFGFALGLQLRLSKHAALDLKSQRMNGGRVGVVDPGSIEVMDNGSIQYDLQHANSSKVFLHQVGITFNF